jgi:hypothetical protein
MATSNVQNNINQTNGQNIVNNGSIGNNALNNNSQAINPITIPIQIQPQISGQNQIQQRSTTKYTIKPEFTGSK